MTLPRLMVPSRNTVAVALAALAAAAVAGTSFWRSFTAIAVAYRVPADQAWMIPVAVDGLVVVATVATAVTQHRIARAYSWFLLVAGTVASVAGNGIHAWQLTHSPIGVGIAVLPPLVTLAAVHLTILLARQEHRASATPSPSTTEVPQKATKRNQTNSSEAGTVPVAPLRPADASSGHTERGTFRGTPNFFLPDATLQLPLGENTGSLNTVRRSGIVSIPTRTNGGGELREQALQLISDGMSMRATAQRLGLSKDKVWRWHRAQDASPATPEVSWGCDDERQGEIGQHELNQANC
ncbi:helix-turn-helix domain-containing protein [Rhodococcus pyridinivorans]|uniref:DUF2637 domain-containing protein n=1 Tax=Rhodococcus pyridinivorans TaxID=103816 RepID=UPI001FFE6B24|nr:helix-turn-helix domain-containing protein [Rhodococcus pyridinivorans]UPK62846.1 helix-turn-helix domain-containing protein [Rhodococcus pyridinivorans]